MREENVVKYYVLCNKLKNIIRSGWKNWNVKRERIESVAEHIFGTQSLALAMYSEYQYDIDIFKVIMMLSVHELEEILIGDLTAWDISKEEKIKIGHEAVSKVLNGLLYKDEIEKIILEFDEGKTKEAIFAYHCDKLECDLQCKLYDEENCVDLENQDNKQISHDDRVKELLNSGLSWSSMWLNYDKSKYEDDKNFMDVLNYVNDNSIKKWEV